MPFVIQALRLLILLSITITLTQCSTISLDPGVQQPKVIPVTQRTPTWKQNKAELNSLKTSQPWNLTARIGITTKEQSASSQLDWANQGHQYQIKLNNALTFGEVKINRNSQNTQLFYDGKKYVANNPEELLLQLTNIKLPIAELEYWILGLPSPNYPSTEFNLNEYATLSTLKQTGFVITYDNFSLVKNRYVLPYKLIIKSKNLYIKIFVESWNF